MPRKKKEPPIIAVIDFETDPFLHGRVPKPFCAGYYEWGLYKCFWGDDCVFQLMCFLDTLKEKRMIYAHNGGKFDFFFMLQYLQNPLKIINGRIAKAGIGVHELRDSYSIIPVPLAAYRKTEIDYRLLERDTRDANRLEIEEYLKDDCHDLYDLVSAFNNRFGPKLTIGSTAIAELRRRHPFESQRIGHDECFRRFYYGGRVEYFRQGIIEGSWKIFDVNSMYPAVMKYEKHPTGSKWRRAYAPKISATGHVAGYEGYPFYFAEIECDQQGAFPVRTKSGLSFAEKSGTFNVTSHELKAALETGRVSNLKVLQAFFPEQTISFGDYVDEHTAAKIKAKLAKDKIAELFAKFLLNSAYGKFGSNPENYFDYHIQEDGHDAPNSDEYEIYMVHESGIRVWRRPAVSGLYFDVATAASITGAARAVLLRAISVARNPVYCDTDSLICESLDVEHSETALGAWKLEAEGDTIAIAGKKLYALKSGGKIVKLAHKGAVLSADEIFKIAKGGSVVWENQAPSFSLHSAPRFVHRKIQSRFAKESD